MSGGSFGNKPGQPLDNRRSTRHSEPQFKGSLLPPNSWAFSLHLCPPPTARRWMRNVADTVCLQTLPPAA
jgi:hypothetical protein